MQFKKNIKTLEDVLKMLGSNKPFLDEPIQTDKDGYTEYFTSSGAKASSKLIDIIYFIGKMTGEDANGVVDILDSIASEEF
jgi:hypothetical protein